jgi:signal transduction histidine kinase
MASTRAPNSRARTGLVIQLAIDAEIETYALPLETGMALFGVAQEALTNVHCHSLS